MTTTMHATVILPQQEEPAIGTTVLDVHPVVLDGLGRRCVLAFSSWDRMTHAFPGRSGVEVRMADLAASWPSDDLMLSIDPDSPQTLLVPGRDVRRFANIDRPAS